MKALPALCLALAALATALPARPAPADPMRPLARSTAEPARGAAPAREPEARRPAERLVAIRHDSRGRLQALIGERWVEAGDTLEQSRVQAVGPNHVELIARDKSRHTLHLLPPLQASPDPGASGAAGRRAPGSQPR